MRNHHKEGGSHKYVYMYIYIYVCSCYLKYSRGNSIHSWTYLPFRFLRRNFCFVTSTCTGILGQNSKTRPVFDSELAWYPMLGGIAGLLYRIVQCFIFGYWRSLGHPSSLESIWILSNPSIYRVGKNRMGLKNGSCKAKKGGGSLRTKFEKPSLFFDWKISGWAYYKTVQVLAKATYTTRSPFYGRNPLFNVPRTWSMMPMCLCVCV